ncbi:hypothetical protein [Chitinolyticbacter albus]|uniref:hypothetical protein n=1 Tax=Chitinolyticbacter albus TaxID=2961951 RepID=UPI00210DE495|nr:hypothetical protein [Chitinolyticbacter albus]
MDIRSAEAINELMLDFSKRLSDSLEGLAEMADVESFKSYRASVGKVLEIVLFEVLNPIYDRYPELLPEQLKDHGQSTEY